MANLEDYYKMVEDCISSFGVNPTECRCENPGQWSLKKGSVDVWVDVWHNEGETFGYFQAMAPICEVPSINTQSFFQEILEINHKLYGVGMTKYENWIYIKVVRELEDLSISEMTAAFNRIGNYADDYDDYLKDKYFGGASRA